MKTLLIISIISEALFVGLYMFFPPLKGGKKNHIAKTVCAVMFVVVAFLSANAAGNFSTYGVLIILGAACGAFGDWALSMDIKSSRFLMGLIGFLVGHILYTSAFVSELFKIDCFTLPKAVTSLSAAVIISLLIILTGKRLHIVPESRILPIILYIFVIALMLISGVTLAALMFNTDNPAKIFLSLSIASGTVLFVISDVVLAIKAFSKNSVNISHIINPVTYFSAQVLIGLSIYFVGISAV